MKRKALVLLSGGLDSQLALGLIQKQDAEVQGITFLVPFYPVSSGARDAQKAARSAGVPLSVCDIGKESLEIVKHPRHGYGRGMNPCIDCHILMLKMAAEHMRQVRADFLVTGEVLGERPMSQRRQAMNLIEKEAGLQGLVVRPLSAKLLPPTIPEQKGWVDRESFLAIRGRSRKPQMHLAEKLGITDYPTPAGGCLLTDVGFVRRLRDMVKYDGLTLDGLELLKVGRHFRLSPATRLVVGRNEAENNRIIPLAKQQDYIIELADVPGPTGLGIGKLTDEQLARACAITVRYSKARNQDRAKVHIRHPGSSTERTVAASVLMDDAIRDLRI